MQAALSVALLAVVLVLVVWQPRGLSIGWPAAVGAGAALALGIVRLRDVLQVAGVVWDATLAFVGIIVVATVLDELGLFRWAALHAARAARGSGPRMLVLAIALGAVVSALFANDGAALILTPIVYEQARALGLPRPALVALVMGGGLVADTTSIPLVLSNLVNILTADYFHLGFVSYAVRMVPVDLVAAGATLAVVYLAYRRVIPATVATQGLPDPATAIRDPVAVRRVRWVLALLAAGYLLSEPLHLPISVVTSVAAALLLAVTWRSPAVGVVRAVREAPWRIVVFSMGMYVIVYGLRNAGLTGAVAGILRAAAGHGALVGILASGGVAAVLSSALNNLPAVLLTALSVHGAHLAPPATRALAYAGVVGADLGTKFTPIGSLATLLWLHVLERRGLRISWGYFMRMGVLLATPVLAATLVALWAWLLVTR